MEQVTPGRILEVGTGFWGSKVLLSAVELGLFTLLAKAPLTGAEIASRLALSARAVPDFPDALVALRFLEREGEGPAARYGNTVETDLFLDREKPGYVGGLLEMMNDRLFGFWGHLTEALKTGQPQNETKGGGESVFSKVYADPKGLEGFLNAMTGASAGNFQAFVRQFDLSRYGTLCDVGGATGLLACLAAKANPHLACKSFDLPAVTPIARRRIAAEGLEDRVEAVSGDFFAEPLPAADVIVMGMILHDWNLEKKKALVRKAWEALPPGGAFVVIEALIDDARRENVFGLLMSLNMLIEFGDAFDYTAADFQEWSREAGFRRFEIIPLAGPSSAAVAYK